jgi:hypothetical protein
MSKLAANYPKLRAGIYTILAGVLGVAAVFGLVTQDQVDQALAYGVSGLGALGFILALFNTPTGKTVDVPAGDVKVLDTTELVDVDRLAVELAGRLGIPAPVIQSVRDDVHLAYSNTMTAAERARADIEQRFGHRAGD